jgi:16S rRNA processing protein RimM
VKAGGAVKSSDEDNTVVGRISGVYGIKGWVKITSFTEPQENLFDYSPWRVRLREGWQDVQVDRIQRHKGGWVAHIVGVDSRNDAELYKLKDIAVEKAQFAELDSDEYYWHELIGLRVLIDSEAEPIDIGFVDELIETGANDVIVVKPDGDSIDDRERLIPYDPESFVKSISLNEKQIVVDWFLED